MDKFPLKPYNDFSKAASKVGGPLNFLLIFGSTIFGAGVGVTKIVGAIKKANEKKRALENASKDKNRISK